MEPFDERCAQTALVLRRWCAENNVRIFPDGSVSEKDACSLCGFADRSALARRLREGLSMPRHRTTGARRFYRIEDVSRWLEVGYDDCGL
ncbi:hypothetical protein AB3X96_15970 [Paraburkholderia sp. BR13439]|uniref:hypothetical protein n=1 Tax=Paraburkholderia sp. BR13439 TaxID=3236996 RepID=UPI0034D01945